ncbi:hypothetical protein WMY93_032832 [Mugilogobius chulae]|uniref:Uncharacterized protein n=1 Tax=Mugilogobius chulae TaxID=88201 RepID=A0AAW0MM00_9GOBI
MFYIDNMTQETNDLIEANKGFSPPVCTRFVLPLNVSKESEKGVNLVTLKDTSAAAVVQEDGSVYCTPDAIFQGLELPRINYNFNAKKYRYVYGSRVEWSPHPNKIAKVDIETRTHVEWFQENCYPSEPVFVPSPGATKEDDAPHRPLSPPAGVILSSIISPDPSVSPFMVVLNARTLEELARAEIPASSTSTCTDTSSRPAARTPLQLVARGCCDSAPQIRLSSGRVGAKG